MQSSSPQTSVMSSATRKSTTGSSIPNTDSTQEAAQGKFIPPPGYSVDRASFSYMNANVPSGVSQQSSSSPVSQSLHLCFWRYNGSSGETLNDLAFVAGHSINFCRFFSLAPTSDPWPVCKCWLFIFIQYFTD